MNAMKTALFVIAALASFAAPAQADGANGERWPRWYVGLAGGVSFLTDADVRGVSTGKLRYNEGLIGTASLGYRPFFGIRYLDDLRFELEGGYHANGLESATLGGVVTPARHRLHSWSTLGNVFYDVRNGSKFTPYVGAGAGWAFSTLRTGSGLGNTSERDNGFAYQFLAGLSYAPASIPLTEWSLGYRYFMLNDMELNATGGGLKLQDNASHSVEIGGRFRF